MGVEFHITRAECWADNDEVPILADEWLAYVGADPDLKLLPENGPYHALWLGISAYEEPWLDWSGGNISTKWPDTALYLKMLQIAAELGANVQDDDSTIYNLPSEWQYDPNAKFVLPAKNKPWWQFW